MAELDYDSRETWGLKLNRLIPHRVREILLVSSSYDAFILEEDGSLTERFFSEYSELGLSWFPRITHVPSGKQAMRLMKERHFDLVLTTSRLGNIDVNTLGHWVKDQDPKMAVVLLIFSESDVQKFPELDRDAVDYVFMWSGDARILITVSKIIEDRRNVAHDTDVAGVPVILVVEDSIRHYSTFLTLLYAELVEQAQSLIAEGVNNLHKVLRLRARPKVLLAKSYEEAMEYYAAYRNYILAVMSDVRFSRDGREQADAGFQLVEAIRADRSDVPFLLQSAERENAQRAWALRAHYVDKNFSSLSREIREFVSTVLGFGDFVFRLPDGTEVGRARDTFEMEHVLRTVPLESLAYHGQRNNFSVWLRARGMFHLADLVRPRRVAEFASLEEMRKFLLDVLRHALLQDQEGLVTDFSDRQTIPQSQFVRLGKGSIGGKARGVAFAVSTLARSQLENIDGLRVSVPRAIIIGTGEFERFVAINNLDERLKSVEDDRGVRRAFLAAALPDDLLRALEAVWANIPGPLAVRSSSLLEDLQFQPFSGIYSTYMLPNNHPDRATRFWELCQAIKAVYASTFCENARSYIANTPFMPEEEKMAVVIQEMVGQEYAGRFYPHFSGIALSHNYYPVEGQQPEEGLALVALGLGQMVVSGGEALRFSPSSPAVQPQFATARDFLKYSQKHFFALDMSGTAVDFESAGEDCLRLYGLDAAEADRTLSAVGSVYSTADDAIRENFNLPGPRVVTFNNVLKWNVIPLAAALKRLLRVIGKGMGCAVEIEFAVDMGDWGRTLPRGTPAREPTLNVLQIRPLATHFFQRTLDEENFPAERIFCKTTRALGHGAITDICDVVYVRPGTFDSSVATAIAEEVGEIDAELQREKAPYLLIGPGRWGTSDNRLGVPVQWKQIAGARVITETDIEGRVVEPSQGTHFFQNITSLGIGYLTVFRSVDEDATRNFIDLPWLEEQPAVHESKYVRHLRFREPLRAYLNGQKSVATVVKPKLD